jgi:glycerol-3-phosphate dehydrogenase
MVPWHGCCLLGTTDTDFEGDPVDARPDQEDVEYLLAAANRVLDRPLRPEDVATGWAGVRALVLDHGRASNPSAVSREYRLHEDVWAKNFISICGGKLTTARALGEKVASIMAARLNASSARESRPFAVRERVGRTLPLPGGATGAFEPYVNYAAWEAVRLFDVPYGIAERIVRTYGSRWRQVLQGLERDRSLAEILRGSPSLLAAEINFAIEEEMALTPEDFLLRRSGLNWTACLLTGTARAVEHIFELRFGTNTGARALNGASARGSVGNPEPAWLI